MPGANPHPWPSSVPGVSLFMWILQVRHPSSWLSDMAQHFPPCSLCIQPTVPAATATMGVILAAIMSMPSCRREQPDRYAPKVFEYRTSPSTGKIIT